MQCTAAWLLQCDVSLAVPEWRDLIRMSMFNYVLHFHNRSHDSTTFDTVKHEVNQSHTNLIWNCTNRRSKHPDFVPFLVPTSMIWTYIEMWVYLVGRIRANSDQGQWSRRQGWGPFSSSSRIILVPTYAGAEENLQLTHGSCTGHRVGDHWPNLFTS